jgi:hypothetical protein
MVVIPGHRRASFFERLFNPEDHAAWAAFVAKNSKRPTLIYQSHMTYQSPVEGALVSDKSGEDTEVDTEISTDARRSLLGLP